MPADFSGIRTLGKPEIFNTDQGSQFTSAVFTGRLAADGIRISMDGRGRWLDNVFIERLWRSLKYEDVYLKGYADGREARAGIAGWISFYNGRRPHQALGGRTPMAVWREDVTGTLADNAVHPALGRRSRVAHMPTATTTATNSFRGVIKEVGAGHSSNQDRRSRGPTDGVHFRTSQNAARVVLMNRRFLENGRAGRGPRGYC